jgi:hypothetical protein
MMQKLDLRTQWKHLYAPPAKKPVLVDVPELQFLMIDGHIEPEQTPGSSLGFAEATAALYGAAYTLKFGLKQRKENPVDFPVMALEGLWWADDRAFDIMVPDQWRYTLMIMQPDAVTEETLVDAVGQLEKKRPNPALSRLRLGRFSEGLCVQMTHVGPYATEPTTMEQMRSFVAEQGYRMCGKHHEIYLGDPRRSAPEKLKTVLRHPVEPA